MRGRAPSLSLNTYLRDPFVIQNAAACSRRRNFILSPVATCMVHTSNHQCPGNTNQNCTADVTTTQQTPREHHSSQLAKTKHRTPRQERKYPNITGYPTPPQLTFGIIVVYLTQEPGSVPFPLLHEPSPSICSLSSPSLVRFLPGSFSVVREAQTFHSLAVSKKSGYVHAHIFFIFFWKSLSWGILFDRLCHAISCAFPCLNETRKGGPEDGVDDSINFFNII